MNEQKIIVVDPAKYLDALSLGEFIENVTQVLERGYGKVVFEVFIQEGKVKTVTITKQNTIKVAEFGKKE